MILIDNIWWDTENDKDLIEAVKLYNEELAQAIETRLNRIVEDEYII